MNHSWGAGGWAVMCVAMVTFWAALFVLVVRSFRREPKTPSAPSPDAILSERFARGEITEDEFRARRTALHQHQGPQ